MKLEGYQYSFSITRLDEHAVSNNYNKQSTSNQVWYQDLLYKLTDKTSECECITYDDESRNEYHNSSDEQLSDMIHFRLVIPPAFTNHSNIATEYWNTVNKLAHS